MPLMALLQIVAILVVVGVLVWGIDQLPIDPMFARVAKVILIVIVVIWLVYVVLGLLTVGAPILRWR